VNPPSDEATSNRLVEAPEDLYDIVKARYAVWNKVSVQIEDAYKVQLTTVQSDRTIDELTEAISDAIQNPI
jgi:hypothetical protein